MVSCTVILAQYNPVLKKLQRTIHSITVQKNVHIQLIIADDASETDDFREIEDLLRNSGFYDYAFCKNESNTGTVLNVWNALKKARYNTVTLISPGDYFYNETAVCDALLFMSEQYDFIFGKAVPYNWDGEELILFNRSYPMYLAPYRDYMKTNKYDKIEKYRTLYYDGMAGPGAFWNKELFLSYLDRIIHRVIYMEDIVTIFAVLDKAKLGFWDHFVVWYEIGSGVSSSKNQKWIDAINHDKTAFYNIAAEYYPESWNIYRARVLQAVENMGRIRAKLLKPILFPDRFFYLLFHDVLFRERPEERDTSFIKMLYEV